MKTPILTLLTSLPLLAQPVFIGTGGQSDAKGIYLAHFNAESGELTQPTLAIEYPRPGFLALHPEKPILYSIGATTVAAFAIGENHSLTLIGDAPVGGQGPCHLTIDPSGRTVAIANYGDGSTTTIRLDADGKPGTISTTIQQSGTGPHPRQKTAHAHGVYFDNANRYLFVPDLGIDKTLIYRFDPATSEISPNDPAYLKTAPGAGPRHLAFSPDEKHAYIINELDNTIQVASFDPASGTLTELQTIPTLPSEFDGNNTTAEVEVHQSGKFVYGSNRGHHSIAAYTRDPQSGKLTHTQYAPIGVETPRHFKIDPSGKWLLVGGMTSNNIAILPIDQQTGTLGEPQNIISTPNPICILFP